MTPAQQRWFLHGALAASLAVLTYLFSTFATVILADFILVLVTWPIYAGLLRRLRQPILAAAATTALVVGVVFLPAGTVVWLAAREALSAGEEFVAFASRGGIEERIADLQQQLAGFQVFGPSGAELFIDEIGHGLQQTVASQLQAIGLWLTNGVSFALGAVLHLGVGVIVLGTLYLEGPALVAALRRLAPLEKAHLDRLFTVFDQLAHNMAYGLVATSIGQGTVAAIGFWLAGAERIALLGLATAVASQVPIIGSAVIWVPLAVSLGVQGSWWRGLLVVVWSLLLTASVDNVVKPMIYHHGIAVHPVLFLIAMLGGAATWGASGLLIGPVVLVFFLTLYTLYAERALSPVV